MPTPVILEFSLNIMCVIFQNNEKHCKGEIIVRIWDISPQILCRNHLLGEHRELHAIWTILTKGKTGYSFHPETLRWAGKLPALYIRHEELVREMKNRGYNHNSPLDKKHAIGSRKQTKFVHSIEQQITILRSKDCKCVV